MPVAELSVIYQQHIIPLRCQLTQAIGESARTEEHKNVLPLPFLSSNC